MANTEQASSDQEPAEQAPPDFSPVVAEEHSYLPVVVEDATYRPREVRDGKHLPRLPWLVLVLIALALAAGGGYALGEHQATGWSLDLSADRGSAQIGGTVTLTAHADRDVESTPYDIAIVDQSTGQTLNSCGHGKQCTAAVTRYAATHDMFVARLQNGEPQSRPVGVTWTGSWTIDLSTNHTDVGAGTTVRLTAETNNSVDGSPYGIYIMNQGTGAVIASCTTGSSCGGSVSSDDSGIASYVAEIASQPGSSALAQSDPISVTWDAWSVSLAADQTQVQDGALVTLTAQANDDIGPSPYTLTIQNQTTGQQVGSCGQGTTCTAQVSSPSDAANTYVARLGDNQSSPLTVTWGSPQAVTAQASNTQMDLVAPYFVDDTIGWIAGNGGTTLFTDDGGNTWSAQQSGSDAILHGIAFIDRDTGWVVGQGGTILHTTDGGATWTSQTSGSDAFLQGIAFTDANNGWAVGDGGTILYTDDGGNTWTAQNSGSSQDMRGVAFQNSDVGWVVGEGGTLLATTDGGVTWTAENSGFSQTLTAVAFTDSDTGWVVGNDGTILHTTDGGATWVNQSSNVDSTLISVAFTDGNNGWAVGDAGVLLHTSDGGATWNAVAGNTSNTFWGVAAPDNQNTWAVGVSGMILHITGYGS